MSLFERLLDDNNLNQETSENLRPMDSVVNQIAIIFANRVDEYWIYDFKKGQVIALHEIFKLDYESVNFTKQLAAAIKAFDSRVIDIKAQVVKENGNLAVQLDGVCQIGEQKFAINALKMML